MASVLSAQTSVLSSRNAIACILGALVATGIVLLWGPIGVWTEPSRMYDTFGKIIVESPEVYTRERLVNDRLGHAVWLERQMEATKQVLKEGQFRSLEGVWGRKTTGLMSWNMGRSQDRVNSRDQRVNAKTYVTDDTTPSTQEPGQQEFHREKNPEESSIELFRAMNEYREHIRTELMQTKLDDRHDIDGNTLYRLNFNTTIVHGQRSDALAIVKVKLAHGEGTEVSGENDDAELKYYEELLRDWSSELEVRLNDVATNRISLVIQGTGRDRDVAEYYQWLRWKICWKLKTIANMPDYGTHFELSSGTNNRKMYRLVPGTVGAVAMFGGADCKEKYYQLEVNANGPGAEDAIPGNLVRLIDDYVERFRTAREAQNWFRNYTTVRPELVAEYKTQLAYNSESGVIGPGNPTDFLRYLEKRYCNGLSQRPLYGSSNSGSTSGSEGTMRGGKKVRAAEDPLEPSNWDTAIGLYKAKELQIARELRKFDELRTREVRNREVRLVQQQCALGRMAQDHVVPMLAIIDLYWHLEHLERMVDLGRIEEGLKAIFTRRPKNLSVSDGWKDGWKVRIDEIGCDRYPVDDALEVLEYGAPPTVHRTEVEANWMIGERKAILALLNEKFVRACTTDARPWLWLRNLAVEQQKDQFNRYFVDRNGETGGGTGMLGDIVSVDVIGCEASMCRISVKPLVEEDKSISCQVGNKMNDRSVVGCFYDHLDANYEAFSYGITPKNLRQRLAFGGAAVRNVAMALDLQALVGGKGSSVVEGMKQEHETLRSVMSQPIVVGFGRGSTSSSESVVRMKNGGKDGNVEYERNGDIRKFGSGDFSRGTEFGWIVAPEKRWGEGRGNWHPHRQYDLSAVVSIPSWWRRVTLTVTRCWRKLSEVENSGDEFLNECDGDRRNWFGHVVGDGKDYSYSIRLPGDIEEVSRKLRIDVLDVPYIIPEMFNPQEQYVFRVGSPASMVIEGGRLWRSTRVTLGTQSANEIFVLPHMKGIIAKFDCIRPAPYWPKVLKSDGFVGEAPAVVYAAKVKVWTSEGVTSPLPVMIVQEGGEDKGVCGDGVGTSNDGVAGGKEGSRDVGTSWDNVEAGGDEVSAAVGHETGVSGRSAAPVSASP